MPQTNRIPDVIEALPAAIHEALTHAAEQVAESARARVPVDSGDLQRAIHVEAGENEEEMLVLAGDRKVFYGNLVEHGGAVNRPAHPFLVPALEENREKILDELRAAIRKATDA